MKLVFATHNKNKLKEVQTKLSNFKLVGLKEIGVNEDIPETGSTLEENALIKARYLYEIHGVDCFADDTGLEIEALNNEPGVYSARYSGGEKSAEKNMDKVLKGLIGKENRNARFRTVIALIRNGKETVFEGVINGKIIEEKIGDDGFGYDPIFVPNGFSETFAEMDMATKNRISHRGLAVDKLVKNLEKTLV